jgi:hypothetical protein
VCDVETSRICTPYIYDIRSLGVNDLTLILLKWRKGTPNNASKWQMEFNSAFKGLNYVKLHSKWYISLRFHHKYIHAFLFTPTMSHRKPVRYFLIL